MYDHIGYYTLRVVLLLSTTNCRLPSGKLSYCNVKGDYLIIFFVTRVISESHIFTECTQQDLHTRYKNWHINFHMQPFQNCMAPSIESGPCYRLYMFQHSPTKYLHFIFVALDSIRRPASTPSNGNLYLVIGNGKCGARRMVSCTDTDCFLCLLSIPATLTEQTLLDTFFVSVHNAYNYYYHHSHHQHLYYWCECSNGVWVTGSMERTALLASASRNYVETAKTGIIGRRGRLRRQNMDRNVIQLLFPTLGTFLNKRF